MKNFTRLTLTLALLFGVLGGNSVKAQDPGTKVYEIDWTTQETYSLWNQGFNGNRTIGIENGTLKFYNDVEEGFWAVQYFVGDIIPLKKGANYVVRLGIKGSAAGSLTCVFGSWSYNRASSLSFTTTAQDVDVTIKDIPGTANDAHIMFQSGNFTGTLNITKVQVFELESVDTYGDAISAKDFRTEQSINWKTDAAPAPTYSAENGLTITTSEAAPNYWEHQFNIVGATTENGEDYVVRLTVKGSQDGNINWNFGAYPNIVSGHPFAVTSEWTTIELLCAGVPVAGNSDLAIQTGDYVATLYVKDVAVYPAVEGRLVSVGAAGFTTFSSNKAVKMRGVTAYKAKYEGGSVTLTPVTEVPAGAGVIIEATADYYKVPVIETASALSDNDLLVSNGSVVAANDEYYALYKGEHGVGFYLVDDGVTIPAGKAYLQIAAAGRSFLGFSDEATAISNVKAETADDAIYNVAGQRVTKTQKGLYIVNGKKMLVK
jgi:hypothetical protein